MFHLFVVKFFPLINPQILLVYGITHLAQVHFIIALLFLAVTNFSLPGTHSFSFFLLYARRFHNKYELHNFYNKSKYDFPFFISLKK